MEVTVCRMLRDQLQPLLPPLQAHLHLLALVLAATTGCLIMADGVCLMQPGMAVLLQHLLPQLLLQPPHHLPLNQLLLLPPQRLHLPQPLHLQLQSLLLQQQLNLPRHHKLK